MEDCCHALEIFSKLNEDHFTIASCFECKNLHVVLFSGKLVNRLLGSKQDLVGKFTEWTIFLSLSVVYILLVGSVTFAKGQIE